MGAASTWARAVCPTGGSLPQSRHHVGQNKIAIGLEHSLRFPLLQFRKRPVLCLIIAKNKPDGIGPTSNGPRSRERRVVIDCGLNPCGSGDRATPAQDSCSFVGGLGVAGAL